MKKISNINELRENIDALDQQILKLISRRGKHALKIGDIKKEKGKQIYAPAREKKIFDRLSKINNGPYNEGAVHAVFREIISATRALEVPTNIAFLGPEATFTHKAAVEHFGHSASYVAELDISSVFREVEKGHADYGVVPIENSTEGMVNNTLDKFVESNLKICSEIVISVDHHLLSAESELSKIKRVYSHPQALAQCRHWLALHLPNAELLHTESTANAASRIVKEKGAAAIASNFAGDVYGLNILVRNIQDQQNNYTRFLVLGDKQAEPTKKDKTSIAFVTKDKPGILYHLLQPLSAAKINLTKIESRPLKTKVWEYMFFVDLDGHVKDRKVSRALAQLEKECVRFKVLGSYPKKV
jgi:chorismate mutase / prephenate dehydratase